ncbi:hypothetical protein [Roseibium sp. M-1]
MKDFREEIEEARAKVAHLRIRAERPGSRLEDEFALEKARTRLLTLELRQLRQGPEQRRVTDAARSQPTALVSRRVGLREGIRTKHEHMPKSARERAEEAFSSLQRQKAVKKEQG